MKLLNSGRVYRASLLAVCFAFGTLSDNSLAAQDIGRFDYEMFSRANCINNESISYTTDLSYVDQWELMTTSEQYDSETGAFVQIMVGPDYTWRSAAINWGGGVTGDWMVVGIHNASSGASQTMTPERCDILERKCGSHLCSGNTEMDVCKDTIAFNCNL